MSFSSYSSSPSTLASAHPVERFQLGSRDAEWSAHYCTRRLHSDIVQVFGDVVGPAPPRVQVEREMSVEASEERAARLLILPFFMHTETDMVSYGADIETEKNAVLEEFFALAHRICDALPANDCFADFTDPASGLPVRGPRGGPSFYPEVQGAQILLKYPTMDADGCSVLLHPLWHTHVYPATLFTTAPLALVCDAVHKAIQSYQTEAE